MVVAVVQRYVEAEKIGDGERTGEVAEKAKIAGSAERWLVVGGGCHRERFPNPPRKREIVGGTDQALPFIGWFKVQ